MKTLALVAALALPLAAQTPAPDAAASAAKPETPKPDAPIVEPPKAEAPKAEPAKAETPKAAEAKAEEPAVSVTTAKLEETKPLPPEPKAESPKAAKFAGPDAEWAFVKSMAGDSDAATQDASVESLRLFARRYPESAHAPDAYVLLAGLRAKRDWQTSAAALLHAIYEYAGSPVELRAKSAYLELVGNKASRRLRPILNDFVNGNDAADKADRLSGIWRKVAEKAPDAFYEPAADEIREFFVRFPEHKDNDKLQGALARLHAVNDQPAAAVVSWRKLLALYPDSELRSKAQLSIGDLYADALREPKKAIDAYQELIASYPKSSDVLPAYENSARLFEEKLKQYDLAVQMDEQIVKTFPKTTASLKALKAIARLQRDRLSKSDEAIKTLQRLSAMHGGQDGVDALLLAAQIARRDLKDYAREAALRHQVADDYAAVKEAPEALYDAAGVYEDDVKDAAKAITIYKEVATKYANDKYGRKGAARAEKLAAAK
jgi:tetratricopeptide (TPR) repeat protein